MNQKKVVCTMITQDRPKQVAAAVDMFLAQTYPNKHLFIYAHIDDDYYQYSNIDNITVIYYEAFHAGRLSHLRNRAGEYALKVDDCVYIAVWDDDDIHDPRRLEEQISRIESTGKRVCVGTSMKIKQENAIYLIENLLCACTLVFEKSALTGKKFATFTPEGHAEMDCFMFDAFGKKDLVGLNMANLYTQVYHSSNRTPDKVKKSIIKEAVLLN